MSELEEIYNRLKTILEEEKEDFGAELKQAMSRGYSVDYRPTPRSYTLLYLAVLGARSEYAYNAIRALLRAGADVDICDYWGRSILSRCITWNIPCDIVEEILNRTADINAVDRSGKTAFGIACQVYIATYNGDSPQNQRRLEIIKQLLEHGADPEKDISWKILNSKGNEYASANDRLALKELGRCYMLER